MGIVKPPAAVAGPSLSLAAGKPPSRNMQWRSPQATQVTYWPVWQFPEQAVEADAAAEQFRRLLGSAFSAQKGRSMLFHFQRPVQDGVEVAYRLRGLLGAPGPKVLIQMVEECEGRVFHKPDAKSWWAITKGDADNICFRLITGRPVKSRCNVTPGRWRRELVQSRSTA